MTASKDPRRVGAVVLNWNGADDTCRCLSSLQNSAYPELWTIVVDNGSRAGQIETIQRKHGEFIDRFIENTENLGYAAGNNVGIRCAIKEFDCQYILVVNNDTILESDTITELVRGANQTGSGIVGPKIRNTGPSETINSAGGTLRRFLPHHSMRGAGEPDTGQYDDPTTVDFVSGACMLVHRDVFETVGLIPTVYFLQWEDIDFCTQARIAGFDTLYWPNAEIVHKENASFEREDLETEMVIRGFRNRLWFYRRYSGTVRKAVLFLTTILVVVPGYLCYYLLNRYEPDYIRAFLSGVYAGLVTDIAEASDPDPQFRRVAQKAKETSTEL